MTKKTLFKLLPYLEGIGEIEEENYPGQTWQASYTELHLSYTAIKQKSLEETVVYRRCWRAICYTKKFIILQSIRTAQTIGFDPKSPERIKKAKEKYQRWITEWEEIGDAVHNIID
jgi:hypothetical protein